MASRTTRFGLARARDRGAARPPLAAAADHVRSDRRRPLPPRRLRRGRPGARARRERSRSSSSCASAGTTSRFVDIGGGVPMSYLEDAADWEAFWNAHRDALLGLRAPLTFDGHGLGLLAHGREILGQPNVYPVAQRRSAANGWTRSSPRPRSRARAARPSRARCAARARAPLRARARAARRLRADGGARRVPQAAARRDLADRAGDEPHAVPLHLRRLPRRPAAAAPRPPRRGRPARSRATWSARTASSGSCSRGAACAFPLGVAVGDIVVFPNTAGYLMHILESAVAPDPARAQPRARRRRRGELDPIDVEADRPLVVAEEARD